jgi:cell division protein FtsW (lipid II flippase)
MGYLGVRRAVGGIGMVLPLILPLGTWVLGGPRPFRGTPWRGSMSAYYYTGLRGVFVGSLFAMAVLLLSYRYRKLDATLGNVACVAAIVVALFPTNQANADKTWVTYVHYTFASIFLVTLTVFCACVFTLSNSPSRPRADLAQPTVEGAAAGENTSIDSRTSAKRQRNTVYYTCAGAMALALIAAVVTWITNVWGYSLFVCEAVAVEAFGIAWLIKGETFLSDARYAKKHPDEATA